MIKYTKNLEWTLPYVESVSDLVPIEKIRAIKGYKLPLTKSINTWATITRYKGKYTITINLWENDYFKKKHYPKFMDLILTDLAHELSHLIHWEHTPKHLELTGQILIRFSKVLEQLGMEETDINHTELL